MHFGRLRVQKSRAEMWLMADVHRGTEEALLAHGGFEMLQQKTARSTALPRKVTLGARLDAQSLTAGPDTNGAGR